jgi:3-hydroxyacyl-CoA dehydrogenase
VITGDVRDGALARITMTADPSVAAADADLLSEAVPEDPKLKGGVLAEFDALCPPRTIFATNTSTLLPSQFAKASGRPDRVIALHFHLPVWVTNLADVMPHEGTAWQITDYWARELPSDLQLRRHATFLKAYVDRGELGVKTGKGFYSYPEPAFARPGFTEGV